MIVDFDILVIGSGIAGLSFALKAADFAKVAIITKKSDSTSNTNNAQGGIAAVLDHTDTYQSHIQDTLVAGAGLCDRKAVEVLVKEGPDRIKELIDFGVQFTKDEKGENDNDYNLHLGREGGHSARRIVHAQDLTGREVERALVRLIKMNHNIHIFEHHQALDLITENNTCKGALVIDTETDDIDVFKAKYIMLSTGGLCQIYEHTTNPDIATGDGVAMAYRAGAEIANLECIQFHPTSLYHPKANSFLISEAVRGEGGILRTADGTRFMENYHQLKELAPRDIVARAIDSQMQKDNADCVYLDVTHLGTDFIKEHFPYIYENCLKYGIDITKDWIPTVPAAHYSCGGVRCDLNAMSSINNLYVCGEVSCTGVHGANRLASNSLLEALVWARRAMLDIQSKIADCKTPEVCDTSFNNQEKDRTDYDILSGYVEKIKRIMWKNVGIVRTNRKLDRALAELTHIQHAIDDLMTKYKLTSKLCELRNMCECAILVTRSAAKRHESRGLNYNLDYPYKDDENCLKDTVIKLEK